MSSRTVFACDPQPVVLEGLRRVLETSDEFRLIGWSNDIAGALEKIGRPSPDIVLVDLGQGRNRLGGSALAQVYKEIGATPPDVDDPAMLKAFFAAVQALNRAGLLLAYHDRSDGGLLACLCEMAFAGHTGVAVHIDGLGYDPLAALFAEELGAVLQVRETSWMPLLQCCANTDWRT